MKNRNHVEERIVKTLREHPEGLPILEIAESVGMNRHTITKYVYALMATDIIYHREIGPAKLCYLRVNFVETTKGKEVLEKLKKRLESR